MTEFVQITTTRLDAGEQIFEAFRILRSGMAEWASWNSSGRLLAHSPPHHTGRETFSRAVSSPSFQNPPKGRRDDDATGRPAFRLDMATASGAGIRAVSMTSMPADIASLTEEVKRGAQSRTVPAGWYIWTRPHPSRGAADLDLTTENCLSPAALAVAEAVRTGKLLVRADDGIKALRSGEGAGRIEFTARLAAGNLAFGVVRP